MAFRRRPRLRRGDALRPSGIARLRAPPLRRPAAFGFHRSSRLNVRNAAGHAALIEIPSNGSSGAFHFIPVGLEAVLTPVPLLDIGARFSLDGYVAQTGGGNGSLGYFDLRALMLWIRFRA